MRRTLPGLALFFAACTVVAPEGDSLEAQPTEEPAVDENAVDDFTIRAAGEKSFLSIDGEPIGILLSSTGGGLSAEVANEPGFGGLSKTVYNVVPEPIDITFSSGLGAPGRKWLRDSWNNGSNTKRNGEIILTNFDNKAFSELSFQNASVESVTLAALDASSKETLVFGVRLQPGSSKEVLGNGQTVDLVPGKGNVIAGNFRFELDGATIDVRRIESFTVKTTPSPGDTDFPVLKIRVTAPNAKKLVAWAKDFLADGNFDHERNGRIVLLKANLTTEYGAIALQGMGVRRFARVPTASSGSEYEFELYVEKMQLSFSDL